MDLAISLYSSKGCGTLGSNQMLETQFLSMGYVAMLYGSYLFTVLRKQILLRTSMPIQDYYTLNQNGLTAVNAAKCALRIICVLPIASILIVPFVLY